jgi:hypothetical protein
MGCPKLNSPQVHFMPLSETWGLERSGFLEKIITAAQSSYNVVENVPSGTCEEIGFERKPAARNGTDAQSSAILSSAFISVLTTAALLLA